MSKRIISGAIIALITVLALYYDGLIFNIVLSFIGLYSAYEYISVMKKKFNLLLYIISIISIFSLIYLNDYASDIILIELIILLSIAVFNPNENYVDMAGLLLFCILIGFALYHMNHIEHLNKWMLGYIFIISYLTDVFAYFIGMFFGKEYLLKKLLKVLLVVYYLVQSVHFYGHIILNFLVIHHISLY